MVNLMDPVPLAVIVLIITSAIIAVVVLTTSGKNTAEKPASTGSRTVERKSPVTPKTPPIADEVSNNTKSFDTIPSAKAVQGNEQETLSVDEDYTKDLEDEKVNSVRITPVAAEEPAVEKSEEKQTQQTGHFEQDVVSDEPILGNEPETINTTGIEGSIANDDYNEIPVDSEIEEQNAQDGDKKASDEGELGEEEREEKVEQAEPEVEPEAEAEVEEEEVGQYDESEYNPDDNNQDYYEDQDGREEDGAGSENEGERRSSLDYATGLSLDTSHSAHTSSATTPRSKSSLTPSADPSGGLSPMKNSSAYKFGSHYQHKKVGASWVKDSNSQASAAAASPVTVSPMRHSQPRKVIPESDQDKPLSTKQSTKISQCKFS